MQLAQVLRSDEGATVGIGEVHDVYAARAAGYHGGQGVCTTRRPTRIHGGQRYRPLPVLHAWERSSVMPYSMVKHFEV